MRNFQLEYLILPDKNLIIEYWGGHPVMDDYFEFKVRMSKDKDFDPQYNVLIDMRDAELNLQEIDIKNYMKFLEKNKNTINRRKAVHLTGSPNQVITSMLFIMNLKKVPIIVKTVSTIEAAVNFIDLTNEDVDVINDHINQFKNGHVV